MRMSRSAGELQPRRWEVGPALPLAHGPPVCLWATGGPTAHGTRAGGEEVTAAEGEDFTCSARVSSCRARGNGAHAVSPTNAANSDRSNLESGRIGLQKGQSNICHPSPTSASYCCFFASKGVIQSLFPHQ